MKSTNVIQACWLEEQICACEYCSNNSQNKKFYLPFHKNVLNPQKICEDCVKDKYFNFNIVDFFDNENNYFNELYLLKSNRKEDENY